MNDMPEKSFEDYSWLYDYSCYECGAAMELQDDVLVCPVCGHSVDLEDWVTEPEDYENYYPLKEEIADDNKKEDD